MCTRFVYRGDDTITGFNFEIDLAVWDHKIITEKDRFYIGILRPDGVRHSYHGVNRNGNFGTLLYVHGNPEGTYQDFKGCMTIADLTEQFVQAKISFDDSPSMWFFTLNITLVPVLVIGVLYLLLAVVIPLIVLHFFNKGTVVERLRTSE